LAIALLAPGLALAQIVELEGRYWFTDVKATMKVSSGSLEGSNVDLEDDLGIDANDAPGVRLTFGLPFNNRIRFTYTQLLFDGDTTLSQSIAFGGSTFNAGTRVHSEFDIHYGRLGWIWQPLAIPGLLKVGPMVELKGVLFDGSIETRDVVPSIKESQDLGLIVPTLGAALDFTPHRVVHLFAEASGMTTGSLGYFIDAEAGIRIVPVRFFTIAAGYRFLELRVDDDDDFGKAQISGPFVGVSVRF
jgi:hypothetical protein